MKNKYYCMTHPTSYIGTDQHGNPYATCWNGKKLKDQGIDSKCDIRDEEDKKV